MSGTSIIAQIFVPLTSCRNNEKHENLEYYFITCIFPKIKLKSGFRYPAVSEKNCLKNQILKGFEATRI